MPVLAGLTVEDAIQRRWALHSALSALLPPDRLTTGDAQDERDAEDDDGDDQTPLPPLPNGKLTRTGNVPGFYSSTGRGDSAAIRLQVWTEQHSLGVALTNEAYRAFDNKDWSEPGVRVNCCRIDNDYAILEDDGIWQFVVEFQIEAQITR